MTYPQKRLLALDGGGLMGLISLGILQRMEDQLRVLHGGDPEFRLRDFFDYIAGTSTGAIIAAGLMMGRSVDDIRNIYLNDGPAMFAPVGLGRRLRSRFSHKFPRGPIVRALQREFTDASILELQEHGPLPTDRHLMMVMHNATTDSCWPISTNPDAKYNDAARADCNRNLKLWQLVRASTAAPSFFPLEEVTLGDRVFKFQDGGITAHNNPALKLFQMATDPHYRLRRSVDSEKFGWETGEDRMLLVSVGTGTAVDPREGLGNWGLSLLGLAIYAPSVLMRGIAAENDVTCRTIGRCVHGSSIDNELKDMVPSVPTKRAFTYARYDVDLSPSGLEAHGFSAPRARLTMDSVQAIDAFCTIGNMAAQQVDVPSHFSRFIK